MEDAVPVPSGLNFKRGGILRCPTHVAVESEITDIVVGRGVSAIVA